MRITETIAVVCVLLLAPGCGAKKEDDNGGDHLPDDKVFAVAAIPAGSELPGLAARETSASFLRRFLVVSPRYNVCLDPAAFDDAALTALQDLAQVRAGAPAGFGLEGAVNYALATVDRFRPGTKPASSRVEIEATRPAAGGCHLLLTSAAPGAFPFVADAFGGQERALLYANQLRTGGGAVNKIPVGYLSTALAGAGRDVAAQYLIGRFLGLGESRLAGSNLSAATTDQTPGRGYLFADAGGTARFDDDAQALYGFALVYRNVVGAADLDSLQHFGDQLRPSDLATDADLTMPAGALALRFVDALGDPAITGARMVADTITVCLQNSSGIAVDAARLRAYLAFAAPDQADSVVGILHARDDVFTARAVVGDERCNLIVAFRNATQYPFATMKVNGLYAREGSVKDAGGAASTLPVIYLNAAALDLDPAALAGAAKPVTLVLQHEFAHFLGFKHSTSGASIMAPAGYNSAWVGDDALFAAYLKLWNASR